MAPTMSSRIAPREIGFLTALTALLLVPSAQAVNYEIYRHDTIPAKRHVVLTTRDFLEELNFVEPKARYTLQEATEHLLQFNALLRMRIVDTFGNLLYVHYDYFSVTEAEALHKVHGEILERRYDLFTILPNILKNHDTRPSTICAEIYNHATESGLRSSVSMCRRIKKNQYDLSHLNNRDIPGLNVTYQIYRSSKIPMQYPKGFTLAAILNHLQREVLTITPDLLSGLLYNAKYEKYDDDIRLAERELIRHFREIRGTSVPTTTRELKKFHTINSFLKHYVTMYANKFLKHNLKKYAILIAKHITDDIGTIDENIHLLGNVYENHKIHVGYLFDLVLPDDLIETDVIEAKKYLVETLNKFNVVEKYLEVQKYQQTTPVQLMMEITGQLRDINFAKNIATSLRMHAKFWRSSHMIESLNELLELFDTYENLQQIPQYLPMMRKIVTIKNSLQNMKDISVEILCNAPRTCLRIGLRLILQCKFLSPQIKDAIKDFLKLSDVCVHNPSYTMQNSRHPVEIPFTIEKIHYNTALQTMITNSDVTTPRGTKYRNKTDQSIIRITENTGSTKNTGNIGKTENTGKIEYIRKTEHIRKTGNGGTIEHIRKTGNGGTIEHIRKTGNAGTIEHIRKTGNTGGTEYAEYTGGTDSTENNKNTGTYWKTEHTGRTEHIEKTGNAGRTEHTGNIGRIEYTENTKNTESTESTGKYWKTEHTGRTEHIEKTGNTGVYGVNTGEKYKSRESYREGQNYEILEEGSTKNSWEKSSEFTSTRKSIRGRITKKPGWVIKEVTLPTRLVNGKPFKKTKYVLDRTSTIITSPTTISPTNTEWSMSTSSKVTGATSSVVSTNNLPIRNVGMELERSTIRTVHIPYDRKPFKNLTAFFVPPSSMRSCETSECSTKREETSKTNLYYSTRPARISSHEIIQVARRPGINQNLVRETFTTELSERPITSDCLNSCLDSCRSSGSEIAHKSCEANCDSVMENCITKCEAEKGRNFEENRIDCRELCSSNAYYREREEFRVETSCEGSQDCTSSEVPTLDLNRREEKANILCEIRDPHHRRQLKRLARMRSMSAAPVTVVTSYVDVLRPTSDSRQITPKKLYNLLATGGLNTKNQKTADLVKKPIGKNQRKERNRKGYRQTREWTTKRYSESNRESRIYPREMTPFHHSQTKRIFEKSAKSISA